MKVAVISLLLMSILSLAECYVCRDFINTPLPGCRFCFCSGATKHCSARSLYLEYQKGNVQGINAHLDVESQPDAQGTLTIDTAAVYEFPEGIEDYSFSWELPSNYGNKSRSYGSDMRFAQIVKAPPGAAINDEIRVVLYGDIITVEIYVEAWHIEDNSFHGYHIPLYESQWKVQEENVEEYRLATRDDMMRVLLTLKEIDIDAPYVIGIQSVSIGEISVGVAKEEVDNSLYAETTELIEICMCPEGYSGDSCESCALGYYRNEYGEGGSIFGTCQRCGCWGSDFGCELKECMKLTLDASGENVIPYYPEESVVDYPENPEE